jgi:fructoselysine 3-epimerase
MQLSFSTNAFVKYSLYEAVERIAAIGYDGVELLADAPHLYADSVSESDVRTLKKLLDRTGLRVANVNANTAMGYYGRDFWEPLFEPSIAHPDEPLRSWRVAYSKKCIDLAVALGSPSVSLTSGRPVPGVLPQRSLELLRESLTELLEYAKHRSVHIGIEYEPGLLIERCEELEPVIRDMHSDHLGANLDLGHSHVLGEDPETVIRTLGQSIFHIHVEDIDSRKHYHLIPGKGSMDFRELFGILKRYGYNGFVTVELYTYPHRPEDAAREALEFLRGVETGIDRR